MTASSLSEKRHHNESMLSRQLQRKVFSLLVGKWGFVGELNTTKKRDSILFLLKLPMSSATGLVNISFAKNDLFLVG
jgi:hypothetical protein